MTVTVDDMHDVGHACLVPVSADHLWEVTARWIAGGLDAAERIVYFEDGTADTVLARLADDGIPVDAALAGRQMVIMPRPRTRALLAGSPSDLEELLLGEVADAEADGWSGLRLAGEPGHALRHGGGLAKLQEFESVIEQTVRTRPARMLCRYDRRHFDDHAVEVMRAAHHTELVTSAVYDDQLLRVTTAGPAALRFAGEVDRSNRHELGRLLSRALADAVRSASAPADVTIDVSSLRFVDVGGAVELVQAAEAFPETHRLMVVGARPRIVRVLDRCGSPFVPRLVVRPRGSG
jgi:anti-anti-sigma regulatory factor